jgi:hypothetical protein
MKLSIQRLIVLGCLIPAFAFTLSSIAAEPVAGVARPGDKPAAVKPAPTSTRYPVRGKLVAVDKAGKTITLKGATKDRVFKTNAQTLITKLGKSATLADAVPGDEVAGYAERQPDGSVLALKLRFGPKPETPAPAKPK